MKKIAFMILVATLLFSCQKEDNNDSPDGKASSMVLTINVNRALTRAVEGGHDGINDAKVSPKILTVTVLAYDDAGVELGATDLTADQIDMAVYGSYQKNTGSGWQSVTNGSKPNGATIGLPKGTTRVDVVVNRAPSASYSSETNINYFNYRDNKNGQGDPYGYGDDNFDRVVLATDNYGKGAALNNPESGTAVPTYKMDFEVKPYMTRMEVHGGINVKPEEVWTDGYGNKWRTMTTTAYQTATSETADQDGFYTKGAVNGTATNGFDQSTVYIPEYYWYRTNGNLDEPIERVTTNTYTAEDQVPTSGSGWVPQPQYATATEANQVKWLPNRYHAVDVESVFINNIKVQSIERAPYMHQWPGSQAGTRWPNWYNAFHTGGWHSTGSSTGNTFLCMGNMWDRIAEANDANSGYSDVTIPEIGGENSMKIITGKAKPTTGKSKYYDGTNSRNIGIETDKAAAYIIYPQSKQATTGVDEASKLRHELPHIILKVKLYKNATDYAAGTYVSGKEFITLSLFSDAANGAAGNYITSFKGGNIYRFNLNDLLYTFIGDVPVPGGRPTDDKDPIDPVDPDPEMPESELIMTVKVVEWVIQNMFPVI